MRDDVELEPATPCTQYSVRDLGMHLTHVAVEMRKGANGEAMELMAEPKPPGENRRSDYAVKVARRATAWSDPAALEGEPVLDLPRRAVAKLPLLDLVLHPWDLNRATGRAFAGVVEVTDDTSTVDKLVALSGRNPARLPVLG